MISERFILAYIKSNEKVHFVLLVKAALSIRTEPLLVYTIQVFLYIIQHV
jgi:hypothetical protein